MRKITRRSVIATGASAGLLLAAPPFRPASAQPVSTRYSATSPQGKDMLKLYAQAVDIMNNKIPKGDPRNWDFQWYTHWIPGEQSDWPLVAANKAKAIDEVFKGKPADNPNRKLAEQMWDDCQAHSDNPNDPSYFQQQFFLPWHRYYVYYFEDIIRNVLQNAEFTLPYWDYLGPAPASASIPKEFRDPKSPLYRANRNAGVNDGDAVDVGKGRSKLSSAAFKETRYINNPNGGIGFCPQLDNNPHGAIHVDVGDDTNMGQVPTAAGDPVFWLHHCNIDRLWESWNRLSGRLNPKWPDRNFIFANGSGGAVLAPCAGADRVALLGYRYDKYYVPQGITAPVANVAAFAVATAPTEVKATVTTRMTLGDAPVRATMSLPAAPLAGRPALMRFAAPRGARNLYLVLGDITLGARPKQLVYDVYLDLPAGATASPADPHYVGTMDFFHIATGHSHGSSSHHSSVVFNITDVVKKLQQAGGLAAEASVTLIPNGQTQASTDATVGSIQLIEN